MLDTRIHPHWTTYKGNDKDVDTISYWQKGPAAHELLITHYKNGSFSVRLLIHHATYSPHAKEYKLPSGLTIDDVINVAMRTWDEYLANRAPKVHVLWLTRTPGIWYTDREVGGYKAKIVQSEDTNYHVILTKYQGHSQLREGMCGEYALLIDAKQAVIDFLSSL